MLIKGGEWGLNDEMLDCWTWGHGSFPTWLL